MTNGQEGAPSIHPGAVAGSGPQIAMGSLPDPNGTIIHPQRNTTTSFFDGSYLPLRSANEESTNARRRHVFGYSIPAWRYLYNSTLVVLDASMALLAFAVMSWVNPDAHHAVLAQLGESTVEAVCATVILVCLPWIIALLSSKAYERHTMGEGYELYSKILNAGIIHFIVLCMVAYMFSIDIPRSLTIFIPVLSVVFTLPERWLMRCALHRNRHKGQYNYRTVIVGSPDSLHDIVHQLQADKSTGYRPIAVCPVETARNPNDPRRLQQLISAPFRPVNDDEAHLEILRLDSHLPQTAKRLKASTMLISDTVSIESETMRTLALAVESMGIELALTTKVADLRASALHLRQIPSLPILIARLPQYSSLKPMLKRLFDIIFACFALVLSSPIMAYVAIRVKMQDGGPAIYRQERIGLYGQPFTLYKFRSMLVDADKMDTRLAQEAGTDHGILFKVKNDQRVTKFGHFIRKTSLDEFPQFFNVLKGDMSIVGPRPQQQYEIDQYEPLYSTRLLVKPGITGPWQISGRSDLDREQAEQLDVSYVENWSLTGDMAIAIKTISAVFRARGSY